jgi:RimJ/RimL family protein N-acetyltransferase
MHLTTQRLVLREFDEHDYPALLAYQSDPRYLEYYPWTERQPEDVRRLLQSFLDGQRAQPRHKFQLAVTLKPGLQLIGNCGIRMDSPTARQGDLGYELSPAHWGQGYATEATCAIIQFGFAELQLHRIWAWCIADNHRSVRVLEKLGLRQEGLLRENEHFKGCWWDTRVYAILSHEWRAAGRDVPLGRLHKRGLFSEESTYSWHTTTDENTPTSCRVRSPRLVWVFSR